MDRKARPIPQLPGNVHQTTSRRRELDRFDFNGVRILGGDAAEIELRCPC